MNQIIIKRIERLENLKQYKDIPDIIIVSKCNGQYEIKEEYCKRNINGEVIKGSGTQKYIYVNNIEEYVIPEGFKGVFITDDLED